MSVRKEVFQSKVLQRLYPAAQGQSVLQPAAQEHSALAPPVEKPQAIPPKQSDNVKSTAVRDKKLYTVLPPPEGYFITSGDDLVTASSPDPTDSEHSPAEADNHELHKKRKRRRRKKESTRPAEGKVEEEMNVAHPSNEVDDGNSVCTEILSKNQKRKMKKKRHKEKLLALGLVPRTRAVEFTYAQKEDGNSEEVLDFLQTTLEIYLSDRKPSGSCGESGPCVSLSAADTLFSRLSDSTLPPTEISRLCRLRALLVKNDAQLEAQLQQFKETSTLPVDEVSTVCTLIEYWLAEILPMQSEQKT